MKITYYNDYESMSVGAGALVMSAIEKKNDLLLCTATGNSPAGLYQQLVSRSNKTPELFDRLRIIALDEWGGLPENAPETCGYYLQSRLLAPLGIPSERYLSFQSNPPDPAAECESVQAELDRTGPIDVCILGLGKNGHLGLNEPASFLQSPCHVVQLTDQTLQHGMIRSSSIQPAFGLTLGMRDIMLSAKIILLITGEGKEQVTEALLSKKISTALPASLLWLHRNVDCLIDRSGD